MANFINGIDVSRWQGPDINWQKVKAAGNLFSYVKATEGTAYSSKFINMGKKQATDAKAAGLKIGYYHFSHPSAANGVEKDATAEANYFLKIVKTFPAFNFPLVLDFEDKAMLLSKDDSQKWIIQFQKVIQDAGFQFMLYSYASYLNSHLPTAHTLGQIPLWLAQYPKTFDINKFPPNPKGWTGWDIWQYFDKGKPNGVPGKACDMDIMTKDFFGKY